MTATGRASTQTLRWSAQDPLLAGLLASTEAGAERLFEVPAARPTGTRIGRIVAGDAWPDELPPLDRLAPVPDLADAERPTTPDAGHVVLFCEETSGKRWPLCIDRPGKPLRWAVDPAAWIRTLLEETYAGELARPLPSRIPLVNYARLPHAVKGLAESLLGQLAGPGPNRPFPELPLDTLADSLRALCARTARVATDRTLWPDGRRAAITLTHDVDTEWILEARNSGLLDEILDAETSLGFRGAWYIVASRVDPIRHERALNTIRDAGHEIGAHGWNHDAKLAYLDESAQERRATRILDRLADLGVEGIRTPWYSRSPELFTVLERHFAYDTSVPSASDLYGTRTHTGCCTVFPYRAAGRLTELPITLPPDTALDGLGGYAMLHRLADEIVAQGGVLVPILHPQPHQSARRGRLEPYFEFLRGVARRWEGELWSATPAEIVRWYTRAVGGA